MALSTDEKSSGLTFPNRVREVREARGLTLVNLAQTSGIFFTKISKIERGERPAKMFELKCLAEALDVTTADLLLIEDGGLNPDERVLINRLRSSPEPLRRAVDAFLASTEEPNLSSGD